MARQSTLQVIHASGVETVTGNAEFSGVGKDLILSLDITAFGGTTPTIDVTIEENDGLGTWTALPQFVFAQVAGATAFERLTADPNVANERVYGSRLRAVWTIAGGGGETYTFSLTAQAKNEN